MITNNIACVAGGICEQLILGGEPQFFFIATYEEIREWGSRE